MSSPGPSGVSFAYPATPSQERARVALEASSLRRAYREVAAAGDEAFLLSTCLRLEVATPGDQSELERVLKAVFGRQELPSGAVVREGHEQISHLFRVAAGVESPVLGEPEVLGQFRNALQVGRREGAIGGLFERLLREAVRAGRVARKMLPGSPYGSLARVAAQLVGASPEIAVFGAGTMARAVVEAIDELPASCAVTVYARRPTAVDLRGVSVRALEEAPLALASAPAAVSGTSAKQMLFTPQVLLEALQARSTDLLLVDLAMPPDFLVPGDAPHLRYFGVDDLADLARRARPAGHVDEFLDQSAAQTGVRLANHQRVGPVIASILAQADQAVEEEVARLAPRLEAGPEEQEALRRLAHRVARRVLHRPISYLSTHDGGAAAAQVFSEAFGTVDEE
ncbi:MAG: hypothetical protein M3N51_03695 [Actinomycetota bacterium]|nr:hypothetical protein [Actinomycetota bacterium]